MQTPPPFHGYEGQMPPQKPKSNGVVVLFAILGVLLLCCGLPIGLIGFGGFKLFKGVTNIGGCFVNAKVMARALEDYEKAHGGKLPNAKTWQADLSKYFKTKEKMDNGPFNVWKPNGEWSCEEGGVKTGFAFNSDLSEQVGADVAKKNPEAIAIFETKTVAFNQSSSYVPLPFTESPKVFSEFTDKHRGWILVTADSTLAIMQKSGKIEKVSGDKFDSDSGFNINFDSDNEPKSGIKVKTGASSDSSNDSKEDNSN